MVAGCGENDSIPNTPETLQHLFQGCHQAGALEKALEVLAWMQRAHTKPTPQMLAQTEDIIDLAQLWDKSVFWKPAEKRPVSGGLSPKSNTSNSLSDTHNMVVVPETLRPAPYDGKRSLYLSREMEQFEVRLCLCFTLGHMPSWGTTTVYKEHVRARREYRF